MHKSFFKVLIAVVLLQGYFFVTDAIAAGELTEEQRLTLIRYNMLQSKKWKGIPGGLKSLLPCSRSNPADEQLEVDTRMIMSAPGLREAAQTFLTQEEENVNFAERNATRRRADCYGTLSVAIGIIGSVFQVVEWGNIFPPQFHNIISQAALGAMTFLQFHINQQRTGYGYHND
ncbi:MAG: hypothetical protein FJX18_02900 [Alphaproteobacteria bacterium]|nr:hypothetical protein [Alphaproteobacteria bacterium]